MPKLSELLTFDSDRAKVVWLTGTLRGARQAAASVVEAGQDRTRTFEVTPATSAGDFRELELICRQAYNRGELVMIIDPVEALKDKQALTHVVLMVECDSDGWRKARSLR